VHLLVDLLSNRTSETINTHSLIQRFTNRNAHQLLLLHRQYYILCQHGLSHGQR
jgi:hypothetical protein